MRQLYVRIKVPKDSTTKQLVTVDIEIEMKEILSLANKAARNKTGKSKIGPVYAIVQKSI